MADDVEQEPIDPNAIFVAVTNIKHGTGELDAEGLPEFVYVESGEMTAAKDFPSEDVLRDLIASGSVAEYKDVMVVEDTAKVEALEAERDELLARIAALEDAAKERSID
jgi:hypothetical protein